MNWNSTYLTCRSILLVLNAFCLMIITIDGGYTQTLEQSTKTLHQFPDSLYKLHSWDSFEELDIAHDTILPYFIDHSLLNAAVFFVTNKIRNEYGYKAFRFDPTLRNMAAFHAGQMAEHKFVGHVNYFHLGYATLDARSMKFIANAAGENVANMFLYQYHPNTRYQANEVKNGYEYITSGGNKISRHTYLSFAYMLVENWMNSPSHRANILDTDYEYLGCGLKVAPDAFLSASIPLAYGVQNFGL